VQETKDNFAKFNDRLDIAHSLKKEVPLDRVHKAASEDVKQSRNNNESEREEKNDSRRDYDSSRSRKGSVDNLRNYRSTSTSNRFSEEPSSEYRDDYRYNPSRRHYSRSDHESSSSHRLRERSNRTYRDKKYNDYEYSSRYKRGRLKSDYVNKEHDNNKSKYNNREYVNLRDRFKFSSSDIEDSSSYKHKKYKYQGIKESTLNMLENKRPYENDKTMNSRTSFATRNATMDRNTECKTKNESNIKFAHSSEHVATCIAMNSSNLEEGEILDSPKKKSDASIPKDNRIANNYSTKIIEDKIKSNFISAIVEDQTNLQSNVINATRKVADIKASKSEIAPHLPQANLEDNRKVTQAKSSDANNATTDEKHNYNKNDGTCRTRFDKASTNGATSQYMRDNDISEDSCKDDADKKLESSVTRNPIGMKGTDNSSTKGTNKIKKLPKSDIDPIKNVIETEKIKDPNTVSAAIKSTKLNLFNDDNETESEKLENPPVAKPATTKAQTALNARNNDEIEAQDKDKNRDRTLDETDIEINRLCLSDHNYVRDPVVEDFTYEVSDIVQKSSEITDCKAVVKVASKETKAKKVINVQSIGKKTPAVQKKKIQQAKRAVVSCRRRVVTLSDSNASMIVMMNTDSETSAESHVDSNNEDTSSKPRLRTTSSRSSSKTICK